MVETPKPASNIHRLIPASRSLPCPFREGSMKAKCWARFLKGGDSATLIAAFRRLGAAGNTAHSWLSVFRVTARAMFEAQRQKGLGE